MSNLALLGGPKQVTRDSGDMFTWPIVTAEHEQAVLEVLRAGTMSGKEITKEFEHCYAEAIGMPYALGCCNGTAAIHASLYALGVGVGHEVIAPSMTYWASVLQVYSLGATPVFAEVDPKTLCIDPDDIEKRISPRTKAIVAVHYSGMPADMDRIMAIAGKHDLKVLEDCSHAHGALYKGRQVGTIGHASGFSLMSGKSLAVGEAGILFTRDREVYERAILFGHYARGDEIADPQLQRFAGLPAGGYKHRMNQLCSAFGLVQLKYYPQQMAEIDKAMNYFCDQIESLPGMRPLRPAKGSGSTRGGWFFSASHYVPTELGGLSVGRFAEAVAAEGAPCTAGCNRPLHTHPLFLEMDVYGHGKPTRLAHVPAGIDVRQGVGSLPVTEGINARAIIIPWFKHFRKDVIDRYVAAYKKVIDHHAELLDGDTHETFDGAFSSFQRMAR